MPHNPGIKAETGTDQPLRRQIEKTKKMPSSTSAIPLHNHGAGLLVLFTHLFSFQVFYPLRDRLVMSFFGFDTNLPRDRQAGQQTKGIFETTDPFAEVARAQAQGLSLDDDA